MNAPRVTVEDFKSILADGSSNDSEIAALQDALDLADSLVPAGEDTEELEAGLYQILIENGYEP